MKRKLLMLTDAEVGRLRAAIRTAQEEDCGRAVWNRYEDLLNKLENAPTITKQQWAHYQNAAGEMLEAGADEAHHHIGHHGVKACDQFVDAMNKAFG